MSWKERIEEVRKRDREVLDDFRKGKTVEEIAESSDLTEDHVNIIIRDRLSELQNRDNFHKEKKED